MTKAQLDKFSGAELLRLVVRGMDATTESFNDRFSAEELLAIYRAHLLSDADILPDEWTDRQVKEAIAGKVPEWTDGEKPKYD